MHFIGEEKAIMDQINTFSAYKSPRSRSHSNKSVFTCVYLFAKCTDYRPSKCVQKNAVSKSEVFYIQIFEGKFLHIQEIKNGTRHLCDIQVK